MNNNDEYDISDEELKEFKSQLKQWLAIDDEISKHESKIKDLKKLKNNILQPQITTFMVKNNVKDINTQIGKIRCNQITTKKPLNKTNIRDNLSKVITDNNKIDQAMDFIMNNREVKVTHILTKPKSKITNTIETVI